MDFASKKIGDMASVTTGLVIKRKQAKVGDTVVKNYKMLTLKSFAQDGWLNVKELEDFTSNSVLEDKYLTQEGDVIVRLSYPSTAVVIGEAQTGLLIPSLSAVIRLETYSLLPGYVGVYVNSEQMKNFFARQAIGSTIQIIKTSMIKEIIVNFPAFNEQEKVVKVHELILKEKELLTKLLVQKNLYHKELINKCLRGGF